MTQTKAEGILVLCVLAVSSSYLFTKLGMASGLSYGVVMCVGGVAELFLGMAGDAVGIVTVMLIIAGVAFITSILGIILKRASDARVSDEELLM